MKITQEILQQFTGGGFPEITVLDLSSLRIETIENLEYFTALEALILSNNLITSIDNDCRLDENIELWNIDLSHNQISNIEGLLTSSRLIGSLKLNNNHLTLGELIKLRDITIIELDVYGNPAIDQYEFSRRLIIDLMPNTWILNGRFITQQERENARTYFLENTRPIREELLHQLSKRHKLSLPMQILGHRHKFYLERFHGTSELSDHEKLQYLLVHYKENYVLAKSLPPKAFASRKQNRLTSEAPFYLKILSQIPSRQIDNLRTYLEATILYSFPKRIQEELLANIFNQVAVELSMDITLISQVVIDLASLPYYSKRGLLSYLFNDPFIEERSKNQIVTNMYRMVKVCNHFSDPSDRAVMRTFLTMVKEIMGRSRSVTPSSQASFNCRLSPPKVSFGERTRKPDPLIKIDDTQGGNAAGYWSLRLPKPGEPVLLDGYMFTLISVLSNSSFVLINKENEEGGCQAIPISRLRWIPHTNGGYWRYYSDSSPRHRNKVHHVLKRSDASIFTANETWTSDFFLASHDYIEYENLKRPKGHPPKWSKIDDVVPFRVFEIPREEFVVTLPPMQSSQEAIVDNNCSDTSVNNRQALISQHPEDIGDNTFLTTFPLDMESQDTSVVDSRTTMLPFIDTSTNYVATTLGGMSISVPERLVVMASRSESMQYLPEFCKRKKKKNWDVVPGKPTCIVANPLQRHPFTFPKERIQTKLVEQPMYSKSMSIAPKFCANSIDINSNVAFKANDLFRPPKKLSYSSVNSGGTSTKRATLTPLANRDLVMYASSMPLTSSRSSLCRESVLEEHQQ